MLLPNSNPRHKFLNWLRYSGACVTITLNPLHWSWIPRAYQELNTEWPSPNERMWRAAWLMIGVRVWIDDGSW